MDVAQRVATLVIREFLAQVDQEKKLGLPVTTFMAGSARVSSCTVGKRSGRVTYYYESLTILMSAGSSEAV